MNDACLDDRVGPRGLDRLRKAGQAVDAADQDVADAAALELGENAEPELCALGLLEPDPENFALAGHVDADREVARHVLDRFAVADLDDQRVEVHDRVDRVQRAFLPGLGVLEDLGGHAADRNPPLPPTLTP